MAVKFSLAANLALSVPQKSDAKVYFEIDRYGDKELKKGNVSKIRQAWRNKMLDDPSIAPGVLMLAINDSLGYNAMTTTGGPDGSVTFEMDREENRGLEKAYDASIEVFKGLKSTTETSLSDVIAFGGAAAIESSGGPRIIVQLGRYDEKSGPNPADSIAGYSFLNPTGEGLSKAFKRAGLGAKEAALLLTSIGIVKEISADAIKDKVEEEEDDLQDNSWEKNLPNSFGEKSSIYGAKIGKADFNTNYIKRILQSERKSAQSLNPLDKALLENQEMKSYLIKYQANEKAYANDLSDAYNKLTLLGEVYENRIQSRD